MVLPFLCKTIPAGQVAVVGDMQAQCLDYGFALLHFIYIIFIYVLCKQLSRLYKLRDCFQHLRQFLLRIPGQRLYKPFQRLRAFQRAAGMGGVLPLQAGNHIVGDLVHHMDRTAVHIENDVIAMILILMYH